MKQPLMSAVGLLMAGLLYATPESTVDDNPDLACEVLTHPREYTGKTFVFKGWFFHGIHATYFLPDNKCSRDISIQAIGAVPSPTHGRGTGVVTAEGRIVIHRQMPERMIGKPAEAVAFSVSHTAKAPVSPNPPR